MYPYVSKAHEVMKELSCLRAKLWFLADNKEHAMCEPPPASSVCVELLRSLSSSRKKKKKKGHAQVFQRTNTGRGVLGSQGELYKQGSYSYKR